MCSNMSSYEEDQSVPAAQIQSHLFKKRKNFQSIKQHIWSKRGQEKPATVKDVLLSQEAAD